MKTLPDFIKNVRMVNAGELAITEQPCGTLAIGEMTDDATSVTFETHFCGCRFAYHATPTKAPIVYTAAAMLRWLSDSLEGCDRHPMAVIKALESHGGLVTAVSL